MGSSGLDANDWRRILTHFGQQVVEISKTFAKIAKIMANEELYPELMEPYNACRLIPLDKNPGVGPIGEPKTGIEKHQKYLCFSFNSD